jgi:hypothetical protein
MPETEHWEPVVKDHEVVLETDGLTVEQRVDRLELICRDFSLDLTSTHGSKARGYGPIRHLLVQRGWLRV